MPSKRFDEKTKVKAVRLVREHADDYDSEWAAMCAISSRLGMTAETLRKWVRQAEVDAGEAGGVPSETACELRELRCKNRELEATIEILKAATSFLRGSATRYTADLYVHRRTQRPVRGRTDLPRAGRAWCADRPAHLLGAPVGGTVEARAVGHHDHRDPGRGFTNQTPTANARRNRCTAI
jgi:transposase